MKGLCEICGSDKYDVSPAIFEGNRILACVNCIKTLSLTIVKSRGEVEVKILPKSLKTAAPRHSPAARLREEYVLVEDYGRRIKTAREAKGLSQEDLAKLLNEKLSLIKKVEGEKVTPPPLLIRKLEHLLKVKLLEHAKEVEEVSPPRETTAMKRPSLGDVAVFKDGEKGE